MQASSAQIKALAHQAAFNNLQNAIVRLSARPQNFRRGESTQETRSLVDQALAAYRSYMQVVQTEGK